MPRKISLGLTDAELRLMDLMWRLGPSSVSQIAAALPKGISLAYSSVLTTLRILEKKKYLRHRKEGRAFIYEVVVDRDEARKNAVSHLLRRFFEDSPGQLALNLIEQKQISPQELSRLRKRIAEAEK